jgi:hypothetical protein
MKMVPVTMARLAELASLSLKDLGYEKVKGNRYPERAHDAFYFEGYTYRRDEEGWLWRVRGRRVLPTTPLLVAA